MADKYVAFPLAVTTPQGMTHGVKREEGVIPVVLAGSEYLANICSAAITQASAQYDADREFAARRPS